MAVTPSRSATVRIDSPARPSVSATAMAAATMASTLSPGLGPGPVRAPGVRHSRAIERAGSPWPARTGIPRTPYGVYYLLVYGVQDRTPVRSTQTGGPHAPGEAARRERHRRGGPRRGSGAAAGEPTAGPGPPSGGAAPLGQRPGAWTLAD